MILTFKPDLDNVKMNQHVKYLGKSLFLFESYFLDSQTHTWPIAVPGPLKWLVILHYLSYLNDITAAYYFLTATAVGRIFHSAYQRSVLGHCWLGVRKSIWPVKNWGAGVVICLEWGAACRWFACGSADPTATLSSLGLTVLVPAYAGCPGKEAIERVSVCQSSANGKVSKVWASMLLFRHFWSSPKRNFHGFHTFGWMMEKSIYLAYKTFATFCQNNWRNTTQQQPFYGPLSRTTQVSW